MKALVLCGDNWHSAQIAREGLERLSSSEFTFDWVEGDRNGHQKFSGFVDQLSALVREASMIQDGVVKFLNSKGINAHG